MLTTEENELLTRIGPGTPAGEFFRRYWQPVGMLPEMSNATPTKHVRILGEDLVLFRDKSGRVGLLADHCPHRGTSLLYGRVEERGIACAYHGWLYDTDGNCLETPAEPADSKLYLTVKHKAYPVREYCGLYWAYLGPLPAPVLPRYDLLEVGRIQSIGESMPMDCNWLQTVENTVDQAHVFILHQTTALHSVEDLNTTRGFIDDLVMLEYCEAPFGIKRRQVHKKGYDDSDLMIFPAALRIYDQLSFKVPLDDTHTRQYSIFTELTPDGASETDGEDKAKESIEYYTESSEEAKSPADAVHPAAKYLMDRLRFQDLTVLETQGQIAGRQNEHLATSDRGVALLRSLLKREIERVQQGFDPIGVIRHSDHDLVDTYIYHYMDMMQRFPPRLSKTRVVGAAHQSVEVSKIPS